MNKSINVKPFYISSIVAKTNESSNATFKVSTQHETNFKISCENSTKISLFNKDKKLVDSFDNSKNVVLEQNSIYFISIDTNKPNEDFYLDITPENKEVESYPIVIENTGDEFNLNTRSQKDPFKPALIKMKKRKGGTYIYCNVPERLVDEAVDTIIMENNNLTGQCFMTFENQNASSKEALYMGYRIVNDSENDIYVTIKNVGYQVEGSWLGEKSWMDYYGIKYDIDTDGFDQKQKRWYKNYLNFDKKYEPNPIKPITYLLPKGKYLYVIGGTDKDAYNNINVNNTANLKLYQNHCANGNIMFYITNGTAKGQLCVYEDIDKLNKDNIVQNLRRYGEKDDLGGRIGYNDHHGVIDCNPVFAISDKTKPGNIKVKYYSYYADTLNKTYKPLEDILDSYPHKVELDCWWSHLSSQLNHKYVGSDMVEHKTIYEGKEVVLSVNRANPAGKIWDYGNWMIEYQENLVIANLGNNDRKFRFYILNGGSLFYIIKDENGNILKKGVTLIHLTGKKEIYEWVVQGHSKSIISVQFVLAANNCGSVQHIVELVD